MAFRELSVVEVREMLRRWKAGGGYRRIADALGADRKTVRRYVEAARRRGLSRGDDSRELDDDLVAEVISVVSPGAPPRIGEAREHCRQHGKLIEAWVKEGCKAPKLVRLLERHTGVAVPRRTMSRFVEKDLEISLAASATIRIAEPPAGQVLEADFMEVGRMVIDGVERKLHALLCVATYSRHMFAWPCLTTKRSDFVEGLEAAWAFFGGVFPVVVMDNPRTVVLVADPISPGLPDDIVEYSQSRGFVLDLARVRHPKDKPKVERSVSYTRKDCFAAERFLDLEHARAHAVRWCREVAGLRIHGTTRRRPIEVFETEERALLHDAPTRPYDTPTWLDLKVGRDHAVTVAHALYSVPHIYRGRTLRVRFDRQTVRMYDQGVVVKVHPRVAAGKSQIDATDLPPGKAELATRDAESLQRQAASHGKAVGEYARRLLDDQRPWTRVRHVFRLLGLCRRYGDVRVNQACTVALELDVVEVKRIDRMLARSLEASPPQPPPRGKVISLRFGRDPSEFRIPTSHGDPDAP